MDTSDSSGPEEVIGKVFGSGSRAVQAARVLNLLHPHATACGLIIPKPIKVVRDRSLLLMERVPGTGLGPVVEQAQTPEQCKEVMGLAAATLARLHRLHFESQAVQSMQTQVEKLRPQVTALHGLAPWLALQVEALLQQVEQAGARQMTTEGLITGEVR